MSDERLLRIEDKIDRISDKISSIDVTLVSQHESLKEHMRRTELLEKAVEPIVPTFAIGRFAVKALGAILGSELIYELIKKFL
jgi:NurA-like 5'-3' nuclease